LAKAGVGAGQPGRGSANGTPFGRVRRGLLKDELDWYREDVGGEEEPGWLSVSATPVPACPGLIEANAAEAGALQSLEIADQWSPWEGPLDNFRLEATPEAIEARIPPRADMYPSHLLRLWPDGLLEFGFLLEPELRQPEHARVLPRLPIAHHIHDYLSLYAAVYRRAGYTGPLAARVALDNIAGYSFGVDRGGASPPRLALDNLEAATWSGEAPALEGDAGLIAKAALDRIWTAGGIESGCPFIAADGTLLRR
jgi:hypothetical protein